MDAVTPTPVTPHIDPPVAPPVNLPSAHHSNTNTAPLLFVLIGLITGVGLTILAILGYRYNEIRQLPKVADGPIVTPRPSASPITNPQSPTTASVSSDWKTYSDTANGYTFNYPPALNQQPYREGQYAGIQVSSTTQGSSLTDGLMVKTLVVPNVSVSDYVAQLHQTEQNQPDFSTAGEITPVTAVTLGEKPASAYEVNFMGKAKVVVAPLNSTKILRIAFYYADSETQLADYQRLIDQILSTFKFSVSSLSTSPPAAAAKTLTYTLPSGWKTATDRSGSFEIGYNPAITTAEPKHLQNGIFLSSTSGTQSMTGLYEMVVYNGGSRHAFLQEKMGGPSWVDDKLSDFKEVELLVQGKRCLIFDGVSISQTGQVWGMCPVNPTQALYFNTGRIGYIAELSSVKFLK